MEIKALLASLHIRRERRNELNLLRRWREWKKKSFRQNKTLLIAKHENNTGFPIIPQQAGAETPPVADSACHLPITSLHQAGLGLQTGPIHTVSVATKKKPFYPGMLRWEPTAAPPSSLDSSLPAALSGAGSPGSSAPAWNDGNLCKRSECGQGVTNPSTAWEKSQTIAGIRFRGTTSGKYKIFCTCS